jgi:D-alanine transaminase
MTMIAYFNGQYLPKENIAVSPDDRGWLFADGLYEVIRSYGGRPFQMAAHLARLARGAAHMRFPAGGYGDLDAVCRRLLDENGLADGDALIYIQVTRGAPSPRAHHFPPEGTPLTVYAAVQAFQPDPRIAAQGLTVVMVPDQRWARCDLKTVGLTANALAAQQARENGASEALLVRDGCVMEGSKSSFLIVSRGTVVAPPLTNYILGSITRQVVETLCRENGIPFAAEPIYQEHLAKADELLLAGTTLEVTPVVAVAGLARDWPAGPVTRRLQAAFRQLVDTV